MPTMLATAAQGADPAPLLGGNQETISMTDAIFKTLGSLAIVVGLMLLLLYFIRKAGLTETGNRQTGLIKIIQSKLVGPKKQVSILKIGEEYIVVGITEQNINLLTKIDNQATIEQIIAADSKAEATAFSFASALHKAGRKHKITKQDA
ncbi:MAG: flagellar biosynthetic protein FliO [Desulfobulbaceae bacterium]|nr:flagellar biosynthetic protein FliO [Desulfobulbaceae bacterium]HIJ77734.1 flagellar biosynthetic protein FliO [Deltaproteobacteria bacterium]